MGEIQIMCDMYIDEAGIPIVTADFTTHGWSHIYGLPCLYAESLNPTNIVPLMFPRSSLKTPVICCTWLLIPFLCIYMDITLKPVYIGMCTKGQRFLEFSLIWIQVTYLLAFHMPWDCSDLTFLYPIEALYKEPFWYIEGRGIEE